MDTIKKIGFLTFELNDSNTEYYLTSCAKDANTVTIPLEIEGIAVTKIDNRAFEDCTNLISVTFPDDVELQLRDESFEIGDYAFHRCTSLETVEVPYGVTSIGTGAFCDCTALKTADLPTNWIYVYSYAFYGCTSLESVTEIKYINEGVFSHCKALTVFPVKDGTEVISEDAFYHCYGLVDITIPASVTTIEPLAFRSCYNLKQVTFANPEGWRTYNRYTGKTYELDLSDPQRNAEMLSKMDFDDGVGAWRRS